MTIDKSTLFSGLQDTLISTIKRANDSLACLIVVRGPQQGKRFELSSAAMRLGRDAASDIVINDPKVSRQQALIEKHGDAVRLIDGGSTNGTIINDHKLHGGDMAFLCKDDLIKVGSTVLKFLPHGDLEAKFIDALETRAHVDTLTQTYNKGYILEALEAEFRKAQAVKSELSLVMVDLDHFKLINDNYGHDAGDYVLIEVAQLLKNAIASQRGTLGRFGGEEFLILLPGVSEAGALSLAERIRSAVEHHPLVYEMRSFSLTASAGVAAKTPQFVNARDLFIHADRALYLAKSAGRNKVCR